MTRQADFVGELLRRGTDINARRIDGDIDQGADQHARDEDLRYAPLGWAANDGRKEVVVLLLLRVAKLNLPDDPPWATPRAWATRRGHRELVELLGRGN